jgi:imidazolonepropionase
MPRSPSPGPVKADLIVDGLSEIATFQGPPGLRTGAAMEEVGRVERGALASRAGRLVWVGPSRRLPREVRPLPGARRLEYPGCVALPGLVDAHTHVLFAGSREDELLRKVRGEGYGAIAASGGGLFRTVRETRAAGDGTLRRETLARLRNMLRWGTTTAEVKSGYALTLPGEVRLLRLIPALARESGLRLVPTFLGAHAVPPDARGGRAGYLRLLLERMIPAVARQHLALSCDVFCDEGFFTRAEARRILLTGKAWGLAPRIHADEFVPLGGARLAAEVQAASADHLLTTPPEDREALARSGVPGVLLPLTPLASFSSSRSPGRELVDAGVAVALGSDLSPNSWVEALPQAIAHAVHSARLTPLEALTASTVNAAGALGLSSEVGRLEPGFALDLAVFPVPRLEQLPYRFGSTLPRAVLKAGRLVAGDPGAGPIP